MDDLFHEINQKYGEWLEMADDPHKLLVDILAKMLIDERALNTYYKKRLDHVGTYPAN